MKKIVFLVLLSGVALLPMKVSAQGFGLALKAGTTGLGADVGWGFSPKFGIRGGIGFLPFELSVEETDTKYTAEPPTPQFTLLADWYPTGGAFKLTGGLLFTDDVTLSGTYSGYAVEGAVSIKQTQPYVGLGFGNLAKGGLGFLLDVGVGFGSEPIVTLTGPSQIQDELDDEAQEIQDAINNFRYFPVLSIGLTFGIGGG